MFSSFRLDGAALFYTSVKEKKNIDKLYKYIVHKCYGYPFTSTAAIVERDAIFIPSGWDNPKKADILLENLHRIKGNSNYSDVFVKPVLRRVNTPLDVFFPISTFLFPLFESKAIATRQRDRRC